MPTLNWNEIKHRALKFSSNWKKFKIDNFKYEGRGRERAEAQQFWIDFLDVFGIERRFFASFEEPVKNLAGDTNFIDMFYKGKLIAEHKSPGKSLDKAHAQAMDYIQSLHREGRGDEVPRHVVVSNFDQIALYDLEPTKKKDEKIVFDVKDLAKHVRKFGFLIDVSDELLEDEEEADVKATKIMTRLHDALEDGGYKGHELERMLVRILFCLFGDDTGIFNDDPNVRPFERYIKRTREDGSDLGPALGKLFSELDKPKEKRQANLDEDLADFPHVNGELFKERLDFADFNSEMRKQLLECCKFNWSKISPAVFGSLFQGVMDDHERRQIGAHYTSERDIMKVIRSLFLDDLRAELETIQTHGRKNERNARLAAFQEKLRGLNFLDPACGCGNFLVLSYRELRRLELDVLKMLYENQRVLNLLDIVKVNVDQFYGIEIEEWPARIAEVAMWLMDHQMNQEVADTFALPMLRLPLKASATIRHDNALRIDWNDVLPAEKCSFVLGNPPFVGKKARNSGQLADMETIFGEENGAGVLDYVACWYVVAAKYIQKFSIDCAFVSTNSITQGEQVAILWPQLIQMGIRINFAHRTFIWRSEARGPAQVHVVIIGFSVNVNRNCVLFDYGHDQEPIRASAARISAYLIDHSEVFMENRSKPIDSDVPNIVFGNMPNDDGQLLLTEEEASTIKKQDKIAARYIREIISSDEYFDGRKRYCLWLVGASASDLRASVELKKRIGAVKTYREKSTRDATKKLAATPGLFGEIRQPTTQYVLIPRHSSENRNFIPISFFEPQVIVSDSCLAIPNATLYHFGILSSTMHMAWVRTVCGRLKSDYRYSNKLVYNNYPWPTDTTDEQKKKVESAAQGVLDARAKFPDQTLANLYHPEAMPPALVKAHQTLDAAVDKCYRRESFKSERERVEYLFGLYEKLTTLYVEPKAKKKRVAKKS